ASIRGHVFVLVSDEFSWLQAWSGLGDKSSIFNGDWYRSIFEQIQFLSNNKTQYHCFLFLAIVTQIINDRIYFILIASI
ncbi:hypothetical protein PSI23_21895, partial [Xenorhabdus sp. XENO-10]